MAKTISYKKLWKLLIDKNMSKSELKTVSGVSTALWNQQMNKQDLDFVTKKVSVNTSEQSKNCRNYGVCYDACI